VIARRLLSIIAVLAFSAAGSHVVAQVQPLPKLESRVTDLTGTLTAAERADLEQKLADFEARKGAQIAVLVVATTKPEEIEQYSIRLVEAWKLGRKKVDDGALLILDKDDRTLRIENGYGLEGVLTDAASNRIIQDIMVPLLRQGEYFTAIKAPPSEADHEAAARRFENEAVEFEKQAAEHEQMTAQYRQSRSNPHAYYESLADHCDPLVKNLKAAAAAAREMARLHRDVLILDAK
jgi:uncharacterized membrane protein YgcG